MKRNFFPVRSSRSWWRRSNFALWSVWRWLKWSGRLLPCEMKVPYSVKQWELAVMFVCLLAVRWLYDARRGWRSAAELWQINTQHQSVQTHQYTHTLQHWIHRQQRKQSQNALWLRPSNQNKLRSKWHHRCVNAVTQPHLLSFLMADEHNEGHAQ